LQNRFFEVVPEEYRTETDTFSGRFSNFVLEDFYGNFVPLSAREPVDDVVDDFNTEPLPPSGTVWFSRVQGVFALFNGETFLTLPALTDDVFLNNTDGEYYIFNGLSVFLIDRWERPFDFDYTDNEYRQIIRRDFERFVLNVEQDFTENLELSFCGR
jgi:hypothetical protein